MDFKNIFRWDAYSDQPHVIRDNNIRRAIYRQTFYDQLKLIATNLLMFPWVLLRFALSFLETKTPSSKDFFGMSITYDNAPLQTKALVEELGVSRLLIRLPLHDMDNLDAYVAFIAQFQKYDLLINILQDREHVEDLTLLQRDLKRIFDALLPFTCKFQIGNAINRKKWAFFSMDEYLRFYEVAQRLKQTQYPSLELIGSGVIDFEYHYSIRTLFNFYRVRYDCFSALLYVDRRGAPENTQMGLNLHKKIQLLYSIVRLSPQSANRLIITETNWPRSHTAPYAPTSEHECVDDATYTAYMVRYYLIALAAGSVESVYWHQLVAPGYGLVDHRNGIEKYSAFKAFQTLLHFVENSRDIKLHVFQGIYKFTCKKAAQIITILWSQQHHIQTVPDDAAVYSILHEPLPNKQVVIGEQLVYIVQKDIS